MPGLTVTPVPESPALFGLVAALVNKVSDAVRTPVAEGVNVTPATQLNPAARLAPQVLVRMAKSAAFGPVKVMLVIVSVDVPLFVSVTFCGGMMVVPRVRLPKFKLAGFNVTAGAGGVTPVPDSVALSGLLEALVVKVREADRAPRAVGVNVTLTTQFKPAARVAPQVFAEMAKSPGFAPVRVMLVIVTVAGPVLVSVTVCALLMAARAMLPNARLAGLIFTANAVTPVPESDALFGLPAALVVKVSAADRTPVADGVNVTLTAQLTPAARVPPQVFAEMAKSAAFAPVRVMLAIVSVAVPLFVSVTVCAAVVAPTTKFPKDKPAGGLRLTAGTGGVTPVPDNVAVSGLLEAFVRKIRVADRAPKTVGMKVTLTAQLLPAVRLAPQVFAEMVKSPGFAPPRVMLVIMTVAGPVFVSVTVCGVLGTPKPVLGNVRLVGLRLTANAGTPLPDSGALFGLLEALVVNVSAANRVPVVDGVNVTLTTQFAPTARLAPQGLFEMAKSAAFVPVSAMLAIVSVAFPAFVRVTVCAAVVTPTMTLPKDKLAGLRTTVGAGVPLPA